MKRRIGSLLLSVIMLFSVSFAEFDTNTIDLFRQLIQELYYKDVTDEQLTEAAIKGMFNSLDKYSVYYNAEEAETFEQQVSGSYVGVGIKMEGLNEYIHVIKVFKDSPAYNAGIYPQDYIIKINGEDIRGWSTDKAAAAIKGEKGTEVILTLLRDQTIFERTLKRDNVQVESCELDILEDNIGYIKIEDFNASTYSEFESMLKTLEVIGVRKLVLDLRDNTGGYLSQCIAVSKLIVPKGVITTVRYKDTEDDEVYSSTLKTKTFDIVLLVNNNTASASEIVAGALKDSKGATIVGTKTYGKGVIQQMYNLKNGGSLKITVAEYLTPNGTSINGIGIEPDIEIKDANEQLTKAIEILKSK